MGIAYNTSIVRNGLVLHLDAANPKSYPGTGTAWYDLSEGRRDSTLVSSPQFSNGSFIFDGTSKYIETPRIPSIGTSTASLTWSVWCSPATTGNGDIINMRNGTGWDMCPIYSTGQKFYARVWSDVAIAAIDTYTVNQFYYLTLVYDHVATNKIQFYVNGVVQGTKTSTYNASGTVEGNFLYFGRAGNQATLTNFNGKISNALIYNKALTDTEIKQNFEALRGRYGI